MEIKSNEIKLALANYPITFHTSLEDWKNHTTSWIEIAINQGANVLAFPEYGAMELTSLFPESVSNLQQQLHDIQTLLPEFQAFFSEQAEKHFCTLIAPSIPVLENGQFYNRAYVFSGKKQSFQDKFFMTRFEDETWGISSSPHPLRVFETPHGKFGIQICFDIEFPVGGHLLAQSGAQFLLVPSCTETLKGATRVHIGARARAMENQFFVAVSQTTGEALWSPAVDINFGYTAVYTSPDGNFQDEGKMQVGKQQENGWIFQDINPEASEEIRTDGHVFNFKHSQQQQITVPGLTVECVSLLE